MDQGFFCLLPSVSWIQERLFKQKKKNKEDQLEYKKRTTQRHDDSQVPQLIYSCVDPTLHLFIVCIYLLGSWFFAFCAVAQFGLQFVRRLGRCCLNIVGFIATLRREQYKSSENRQLDYCAFNQIGCVREKEKRKSIWCLQCIHTAFWLFAGMKPEHIQTWKPTCSRPASKVSHSIDGVNNTF